MYAWTEMTINSTVLIPVMSAEHKAVTLLSKFSWV
jgi:hypothetical protein